MNALRAVNNYLASASLALAMLIIFIMVAALFFKKDNPLKPGDEVIVPAVSWSTTYYPLSQYGLKLKFVDIDKESLNYDLEKLSEAISENTKLLMVVNILGNPNNFSTLSLIHI